MPKRWLLLPLLFLPLLTGCHRPLWVRAADVSALPVGYQVGERAPEFDLLAVGQGRSVRLADLKGKPVILNFFCGCNFCSLVGKEWLNNKDRVGDTPILAIEVNHWSYAPVAVREFRTKTGWPWPMLADFQSATANQYHAFTCPRVFVVDARGVIRYASAEGASDQKQLVAAALVAAR
jgi:peroxiredoxin